jgi:hypothetical protein
MRLFRHWYFSLFYCRGFFFPAGESVNVWFSGAGILKLNKAAWMLTPWGE